MGGALTFLALSSRTDDEALPTSGHDYISEKQAGRAWLFFAIFASLLLSFDFDPAGLVAIETGVRFLSYFSLFRHFAFL